MTPSLVQSFHQNDITSQTALERQQAKHRGRQTDSLGQRPCAGHDEGAGHNRSHQDRTAQPDWDPGFIRRVMPDAQSVQTHPDEAHEGRQNKSGETGEGPFPWLPHQFTLRIRRLQRPGEKPLAT